MALEAGIAVTLGFWICLLAYYSRFTPSSANRITTNPVLFIAWVIAIAALAHWFWTARPASSRGAIGCVAVIGFGVLALNAIRLVFPGTASTPLLLLALAALLLVTRCSHDLWTSRRGSVEPRPVRGRAAYLHWARPNRWVGTAV